MAEKQWLSWNPDTHGEEIHRSTSGTRPQDHSGTPDYLLEFRCVRQSENTTTSSNTSQTIKEFALSATL